MITDIKRQVEAIDAICNTLRTALGSRSAEKLPGLKLAKIDRALNSTERMLAKIDRALNSTQRKLAKLAEPLANRDARRVLAWLRGCGQTVVSRRDLWRGVRRHFGRPEDLEAPLRLLTHLNYVRPVEVASPVKGGRPRVPVYEITPHTLERGDDGDEWDKTPRLSHPW
jgi:hypothetical protein